MPFLEQSMKESPPEFVFPGPDGEMMSEQTKLGKLEGRICVGKPEGDPAF